MTLTANSWLVCRWTHFRQMEKVPEPSFCNWNTDRNKVKKSFRKSEINSCEAVCRWGSPIDASAVMVAHPPMLSATCSSNDNDQHVNLFIDVVLLCNNYLSLFAAVWFSAAYHVERHGWITITSHAWWLTVRIPVILQEHWPVAICIRLFCVISMIY